MPAFTKYGYQKMKIPVELHNFILQSMKQNSSGLVNEPCTQDDPFHNCQRVKNDGTIGKKNFFCLKYCIFNFLVLPICMKFHR